MMIPFKKAPILGGFSANLPVHQWISGTILTGLVVAWASVTQVWAIDSNRQATHSVPTAQATNGMPDLDQLTRDLQRFLGGARTAAIQRGTSPKASVNTVKDPATNAQPTWWVTAAENGTARQIKLKGKPVGTGLAQPKSKRTETETMSMIQSFLSSQSSALKLEDPNAELTLVSSETDSLGYRHLRYTQKLGEVPVWPTGLTVHLAPDGELHLLTASIVPTPSAVSRIPAIDADKAVERAKSKVPGGFRGTNTIPELILHWDSDAAAIPVRLAWKFRVSVGEHASWTAIMDAQKGGEISIQSDARTGSVIGSGTDLFGVTKTFPVWEQGGVYYMIDTTKPSYNRAPDPFESSADGMIAVFDYAGTIGHANLVTNNSRNGWVPPDAVSVHSVLGSIYDYYFKEHGRNGLSGLGDAMRACVRYGDPKWFNNAFYSGGVMFFGEGNNSKAKCIDVAAHEFTHGVVEYSNAKLEYVNQSGALNEAFADILGKWSSCLLRGQMIG
jgi:Zn-dependent metalloprotease